MQGNTSVSGNRISKKIPRKRGDDSNNYSR